MQLVFNLISQLTGWMVSMFNRYAHAAHRPPEGDPERVGASNRTGSLVKSKKAPLEARIRELFARYGYVWDSSVNLFGVRDETGIRQDVWNDLIVAVVDGQVKVYLGTCDPGVYWTSNANRRRHKWADGAAHLCLGQHLKAYQVGTHGGYEALAQWGAKVTVWRDINENFLNDDAVIQSGFFGINIHKGSGNTIGRDSAGCQVIRGEAKFLDFMAFVKSSLKFQGNRWAQFNYTLFEKGQVGPLLNDLKALL